MIREKNTLDYKSIDLVDNTEIYCSDFCPYYKQKLEFLGIFGFSKRYKRTCENHKICNRVVNWIRENGLPPKNDEQKAFDIKRLNKWIGKEEFIK